MEKIEAFHVLASADRQLVLDELAKRDGEASIDELSRQVAGRRHRISPEAISTTKTERARVRLIHTHLPRLAETNVVDLNWEEKTVSLRDIEETDRLFEAADELENWPPDDLAGISVSEL
ncbi:hypothetical protein EA473_00570 [Natrarchaeobius chitinivorans]|uniref:DUF7344 domain-containing protein n=2 Tax=Natrarchaeobius chitinivorans TaxID=1679083 RepID=A0A3N6PHV1_NATCH|nr:hypothetical protein [Natrarchaeobius chitinivorans]RQG97745.1 hypothetical protein EA473_00570 [Natrarchaeobius chitinivorans]